MKPDPTHPHIPDMQLQELLDGELPRVAQTGILAHLAACPACSARLEGMRSFFASIEALPDATLTTDLAPGVLERIAAQTRPVPAVRSDTVRSDTVRTHSVRTSRWVFGLQLAASLALLSLFWPAAWSQLQNFAAVARVETILAQAIAILTATWQGLQSLFSSLAARAAELAQPPALPAIGGVTGILVVSAAAVLWLAGNGYLIWNQTHLRRRK